MTPPTGVLVADDTEDMRMILRMLLTGTRFHVIEAASGTEALELWDQRRDEVFAVVLDQRMPGRTGIEVATRIRADDPSCPVVLLTAQLDPAMEQRAATAGITAVVEKDAVFGLVQRLEAWWAAPG